MEHCKSEQEVRAWAKINGYTNGEKIDAMVESWKASQTVKVKVDIKVEDVDEEE
jgi:hypothetical protein